MKPETIADALLHCKSSMQDCGTCPAYPAYLKSGACHIVDDAAGAIKGLKRAIRRVKEERCAEWIYEQRPGGHVWCSKCNKAARLGDPTRFCWNCGRRMSAGGVRL